MNEYYHPSSDPIWVNADWLRKNTTWIPDETPLETLAENGFYQIKTEPTNQSPDLYRLKWENIIASPYCIRKVTEITPRPLPEAKAWMLETFPDHADDINAATSVDELQQILDSIQAPT